MSPSPLEIGGIVAVALGLIEVIKLLINRVTNKGAGGASQARNAAAITVMRELQERDRQDLTRAMDKLGSQVEKGFDRMHQLMEKSIRNGRSL